MLTLRRNLMHVTVGLALLFIYLLLGRIYGFIVLAAIFVTGTYFQMQLRRGKKIPQIEKMLRLFETEDEIENWRGLGAQTLVLGVALTILLFPTYAAIPAILVLAFADAASAIFGSYVKSSNILEGRTLFGSMSFFIVSFIVLKFFFSIPLALFVAISATLIELIPLPDDNVWIPLGTALLITVITPFF